MDYKEAYSVEKQDFNENMFSYFRKLSNGVVGDNITQLLDYNQNMKVLKYYCTLGDDDGFKKTLNKINYLKRYFNEL